MGRGLAVVVKFKSLTRDDLGKLSFQDLAEAYDLAVGEMMKQILLERLDLKAATFEELCFVHDRSPDRPAQNRILARINRLELSFEEWAAIWRLRGPAMDSFLTSHAWQMLVQVGTFEQLFRCVNRPEQLSGLVSKAATFEEFNACYKRADEIDRDFTSTAYTAEGRVARGNSLRQMLRLITTVEQGMLVFNRSVGEMHEQALAKLIELAAD